MDSQTRPAAGGEAGMRSLKVALLGCGGVGSEVYRLLGRQAADLEARIGVPIEVAGVAVRRPARHRDVEVDPALLTGDAMELATRPGVDIVVEVIGGIEPARSLLLAAMKNGKSVVSANKALLAEDGATLHQAARDGGTDLYYEAAVGGAIPLLRPLRESLAGDAVRQVLGIVNGTTNYILDRMDTSGAGFTDALEEAQALGYAEPDPTADIEGFDAAAKGAILASLAFHTRVTAADVYREGITGVTQADIVSARVLGHVVKLLAICERNDSGVSVRVHPAMIPRSHPLAGVRGMPTASAVLGDVVAVARNRLAGTRGPDATSYAGLQVLPVGQALTRYHIALDVADRPGVLARVAESFARHEVSIKAVRQEGRGDDAQLVIVTHTAPDAALAACVADLGAMDVVRAVASVMRVEGESDE